MAEKTVRTAVHDQLTANCLSFTGGFFQPQIATSLTPKPFGVVRMGPEDAAQRQGKTKRVYVAVHAARDDYDNLDALCRSVVAALNGVKVSCGSSGGNTFWVTPWHVGTTGDANDDDRETIFRICEFEVVTMK